RNLASRLVPRALGEAPASHLAGGPARRSPEPWLASGRGDRALRLRGNPGAGNSLRRRTLTPPRSSTNNAERPVSTVGLRTARRTTRLSCVGQLASGVHPGAVARSRAQRRASRGGRRPCLENV